MRLPLPTQSNCPNFIGSWLIKPISVCDELIDYFELKQGKHMQGRTSSGLKDLDRKNSVDLTISPKELNLPTNECFRTYFKALFECYSDYAAQWPFIREIAQKPEIGRFNIQRYQINQHFQRVHTERSGLSTLHRLFAWMTYLNDVPPNDGGSTIFTHYDLEIQPQKRANINLASRMDSRSQRKHS